jgi:hypothetical protein
MLYYSCEMLCGHNFLQILIRNQADLKIDEIKRFRKYIINFKSHADNFIRFV